MRHVGELFKIVMVVTMGRGEVKGHCLGGCSKRNAIDSGVGSQRK